MIFLAFSMLSLAYDFEVDGIYYDKNSDGNTVTVTYKAEQWGFYTSDYKGDIIIPQNVLYDAVQYQVESIGDHAFYNCTELTSVTIPNSVTSIGNSAFYYCSGLISINLPNSMVTIGDFAFERCSGLTSITIPSSVTSIGKDALESCYGLVSITVVPDNVSYDSRNNCNALIETASNKLIVGCRNTKIPNGVTTIGEYAFRHCSGCSTITIPESVLCIERGAFEDSELTSITIPNSVKTLGRNLFEDSPGIETVIIGDGVTEIPRNAFIRCKALKSVTIGNNVSSIERSAFSECEKLESIVIPNSVITIEDDAFEKCSNLSTLHIGTGLKNLDDGAFDKCTNLYYIIIDEGNPWLDSRNNCNAIIETASNTLVMGCKTTVVPNSVTSIGPSAFYRCIGLASIVIPNGVISIGERAFSGCSELNSISIPESVTSIDGSAFADCTSLPVENNIRYADTYLVEAVDKTLNSYNIKTGTRFIGYSAFNGCSDLASITIPNSVMSINNYAFSYCSNLVSVTVGENVSSIGGAAFADCSSLKSVTCLAVEPPVMGSEYILDYLYSVFNNVPLNTATLYVPAASVDAYKTADQWKDFGTILPIDPMAVKELKSVDSTMFDKNSPVFDLNGRQLSEKPASGYYIQGGKKYYTK